MAGSPPPTTMTNPHHLPPLRTARRRSSARWGSEVGPCLPPSCVINLFFLHNKHIGYYVVQYKSWPTTYYYSLVVLHSTTRGCCCCCCLIGHRDPAAFANCNGMQCTRVWILLAMYSVVVCIRVVVNYLPSAKFWHMQRVNLRSKGIFDALARFVIGMAGLRIRLQAESIIGRVAG